MRKTIIGLIAAALFAIPLVASAGVSGPAFYVDGELYRTVGTPTDFSNTGAPDHSFDTIYGIPEQMNVATAAPGDRDYNGGRWMVEAVEYVGDWDYDSVVAAFGQSGDPDVLDSAEEVEAAEDAGAITTTVVRSFECPVIPLPRGRS